MKTGSIYTVIDYQLRVSHKYMALSSSSGSKDPALVYKRSTRIRDIHVHQLVQPCGIDTSALQGENYTMLNMVTA